MSNKLELLMTILDDLKTRVAINKYPTKQHAPLLFEIPAFIEKLPLVKYLTSTYGLTATDVNFILTNLRTSPVIQPGNSYVQIGEVNEVKVVKVVDHRYGAFHIYGNRGICVTDPNDVKSSLTSFICSQGVTAFVHKHKQHNHPVVSVYYGNKFDDLQQYIKLRLTAELYEAYILANIESVNNFVNGDYHESYQHRS